MSSSDEEELILVGVRAIDLSRPQPQREKQPVDPLILLARRVMGTEWKNDQPDKSKYKMAAAATKSSIPKPPSEVNKQEKSPRTAAKKPKPEQQKKKAAQPKTSAKKTVQGNQAPFLQGKRPRGRPRSTGAKTKPVGYKPVPKKKPVVQPVRVYKSKRLQEKDDLQKAIDRSIRQEKPKRVHYMLGVKGEPMYNPEEDLKDLGHLSDLGKSSESKSGQKSTKVQAATARVIKPESTIPSLDLKTEPLDDAATPSAANPWGSTVGMEIVKTTTDQNEVIDLTEWEVERILAHRVRKGDLSFKVRWQYWSSDYDSWEPKEHLTNCPEILEAYVATLSEKQREKILELLDIVLARFPRIK